MMTMELLKIGIRKIFWEFDGKKNEETITYMSCVVHWGALSRCESGKTPSSRAFGRDEKKTHTSSTGTQTQATTTKK